jgi:outer membrane protein assembly factor BamB
MNHMTYRWMVGLAMAVCCAAAPEWTRFRGPNGTGVNESGPLPVEFGKKKNLVWRTALAPGYSSPVLGGGCVYVTSYDGPKEAHTGWTHCIDVKSGAERWKRQGFQLDKRFLSVNTPVSATTVTDGSNVYVFFEAAGLISYDAEGKERWRRELGRFNNPYGMANSPILFGKTLILQADQDTEAYLLAVDAATGKTLWRKDRPEAQHGYSTPVVWQPKGGAAQLIVSGSYQVAGYSVETGEKLWWVEGMAWQAKSVPVLDGDRLYVHSWMAELSEIAGKLPKGMAWEAFVKEYDKDGDGKIGKPEAPDEEMTKLWFLFDLDRTGSIEQRDYEVVQARANAKSGLFALDLGGRGDLTKTAIRWKAEKTLPNIPSPVLYRGVLYVLKEGGILTAYAPADGKILKQGRVDGAVDTYFASPVASDGKLITAAKGGKVAVVKAGAEWEVLRVNDLEEEVWATPAVEGGRLFVRTQNALYCFGTQAQ